jgi:hypothetical protein
MQSDYTLSVTTTRRAARIPMALMQTAQVAIIVQLAIGAGCLKPAAPLPEPLIWAESPGQPSSASVPPPDSTVVFDKLHNLVHLDGAVNETTAFTLFVSAQRGAISGVEIFAEQLVGADGAIPKEAIRLYRFWPIRLARFSNWYLRSQGPGVPREFPDALVPIETPDFGQPFAVAANERIALWVEIETPADAKPGLYRSALTIGSEGRRIAQLSIELTVRDIFLADNQALPVHAAVDIKPIVAAQTDLDPDNTRVAIGDETVRRLIRHAFELLHSHRLDPFTADVRPRCEQTSDGSLRVDWSDYDGFCGPLIDGSAYADRRPARAWPLPIDIRQPNAVQYDGDDSLQYTSVFKDYLIQCRSHFEEKRSARQGDGGWPCEIFVDLNLPMPSNPGHADVERFRRLAAIVRDVNHEDAKLDSPEQKRASAQLLSMLVPQPMGPYGWMNHYHEDLSDLVGIWATPARYQHPQTLDQLHRAGKATWLPSDRPPFGGCLAIEAASVSARSLPWQAFLQRHDAIYLRRTTNWPSIEQLVSGSLDASSTRTDSFLIYPGRMFGREAPVASFRLKQLMLGLQDYQYLRLLEAHGRGETARLLAGSLVKAVGTQAYGDNYQDGLFDRCVDNPEVWQLARHILVEETASVLAEEVTGSAGPGASKSAWGRLLGATRRIVLTPDPVRLFYDEGRKKTPWRITCDVAIRNELRMPVEGSLRLGAIPEGSHAVMGQVQVGPLAEMELARRQLIIGAPSLQQTDLDGHAMQKVIFDAGTTALVEANAPLSMTTAANWSPGVGKPPAIDGRLDDWPPIAGNVAGDFHLVGRTYPDARANSRAASQTVAYFLQREGVLYVGIHAALAQGSAALPDEPVAGNYVRYEDLMPIGEDLVEILLDPTNAGVQSEDLFHIVIKSTGIGLFEKGVAMEPPLGESGPWPGGPPKYAVARSEDGWSAEVAIPVASFGPTANPRVWGLNVTRLEPQRGEYSDWAGAPRYCYDPRTLGNLVWPK